jgi:hypothetical protein
VGRPDPELRALRALRHPVRVRPRSLPFATLAALALTALNACGDDDGDADEAAEPTTPSAVGSSPPPTPPAGVRMNVGTWKPGDPADHAALTGTVAISDTGCIHVQPRSRQAAPIDVLWPAGSAVLQVGTAPMEIRNEAGEPVARIGTSISFSGGVVTASSGMPELDCQAGHIAEAFAITEELRPLPGS